MKDIAIKSSQPISLFPSEFEWAMLKEQAQMVVRTGLLPAGIDTPEKAIAVALKGREMGIPPMHAYAHIHIIKGKPTMSAELMLAMIFKNCPGSIINYLETSAKCCRIEASRPGHKPSTFEYTIEEAKTAGLLNKDSWRNYAPAMLRARTVAIVARALFADAIMGVSYTPEELGEEVGEDGETIEVKAAVSEKPKAPAPTPIPAPMKTEAKVIEPKTVVRTRKQVGTEIMLVAGKLNIPEKEVHEWATDRYKVPVNDLTIAQLEDFLGTLKAELSVEQGAEHE